VSFPPKTVCENYYRDGKIGQRTITTAQTILNVYNLYCGVGVAQPVQCLITDWTTLARSRQGQRIFHLASYVQTISEAHQASCLMGTGLLSQG
jgi:hypothetical protein